MDQGEKEKFLATAVDMLSRKKNCHVLMIVESEDGLEMLQSVPSFIWTFGILASAEKKTDETYRSLMGSEDAKRRESQILAEMDALVTAQKGKAN